MIKVKCNYIGNRDILNYMSFETITYQLSLINSMLRYSVRRNHRENINDFVSIDFYLDDDNDSKEVKHFWKVEYTVVRNIYERTRHNYGFGDMVELRKIDEDILADDTYEGIDKLSKVYRFAELICQSNKEWSKRFRQWEKDILQEKLYQWVYENKVNLNNKQELYELIDEIESKDLKEQKLKQEFSTLFIHKDEIDKLFLDNENMEDEV